jgi:hypothetical protein
MVWMLLAATEANAGVVLGIDGGTVVPMKKADDTDTGAQFSLHGGYRWTFGVFHLRPEIAARWNLGGKVGQATLGVVGTFGGTVAFGPYAHVGIPIDGDFGPVADAGGLIELALPALPLLFHVRAGWQQDRLEADGSSDWFVVGIGASVDL